MQGSLLDQLQPRKTPDPQPDPRPAHTPHAPLAERMRPATLEAYLGQEHLLGEGRLLRTLLQRGALPSLILWGPPGAGKTTLARLIASQHKAHLIELSAVLAGAKEIRDAVSEAQQRRALSPNPTLLFVDEVHRFNKAQQDLLLPHVERGTVTLLGATTENPAFALNNALLSRCRVLRLEPLPPDALDDLLQRALTDAERGLGGRVRLTHAARKRLIEHAHGDARVLLTTLEVAALQLPPRDEPAELDLHPIEEAIQHPTLPYDRDGEHHFNYASALIKSLRGSDPDAALYYTARMIESGEDPLFILRRLVIFASEDVGNADPTALQVAVNATAAFQLVGLPEGTLAITQAVTYLATAPKSHAVIQAWKLAQRDVREHGHLPPPPHITHRHADYQNPHLAPGHYAPLHYLPQPLRGQRYYQPSDQGHEATLQRRLQTWHDLRDAPPTED